MPSADAIRDGQRAAWAGLSAGWDKWDSVIMEQLGPVGAAMIERLDITDEQQHLDIASGTGEPGLSIARLAPTGRVVLTDLSAEMLARAREGQFSQLEINRGLPATHLVRHFERSGTGWRVNEQLRRMVTFQPHNLLNAPPLGGPFDIVFIRNVLIYFSPATKSEVLAKVRRALRPDGFVVLGGAETSLGIDDQLVRTEIARSSVYRLKR